jgi:hypothetical protein
VENNGFLIVLVIAAALVFGGYGAGVTPSPSPTPAVVQPSADTQAAFADLRATMSRYPEAARFGAEWRDLHAVIGSTGTKITTNQQLRDLVDKFSRLLVTQRYAGSPFIGFTDGANKALTKLFGDESVAIDPNKASDYILGIAWACGG